MRIEREGREEGEKGGEGRGLRLGRSKGNVCVGGEGKRGLLGLGMV